MSSRQADPVELFVPGRLCLFGEHSDWAGHMGVHPGHCLVIGTDQGLHATAGRSEQFIVETALPNASGADAPGRRTVRYNWDADALSQAANDREEFFRYCAGVACQMFSQAGVGGGIELHIDRMDLPLKKGVSSSAAVCVLVASAFDRVYELGLFPHEIMDLAYRGERLTGSQCGRMDQACTFGKTPVLLTFSGSDNVRVEPIFPRRAVTMFFVDLAGRKDTIGILSDLRRAYPDSPSLQRALGAENERIVRRACRAVADGDAESIGDAMRRAQEIFDRMVAPHSPEQLASPRLHEILNLREIQSHIYGGKGVGSQGDGTAQFVARSPQDQLKAMAVIERMYENMRCFPLSILPAGGELGDNRDA
ncbi:MAG: GHMP kinase [Planctomycetes bacterium]|nr:GHMP kinase [Planctomycetota bacterium]